jgi:hypothetical protein
MYACASCSRTGRITKDGLSAFSLALPAAQKPEGRAAVLARLPMPSVTSESYAPWPREPGQERQLGVTSAWALKMNTSESRSPRQARDAGVPEAISLSAGFGPLSAPGSATSEPN